ncbi:MAG: glycosyltransferase family 2 protein [Verrucomicrobiota bacterium]
MTTHFTNYPTLADLPAPPPGRVGWPWTESSPPLPLSGGLWPRISIITPSYNQGKYLEETIRSVLLQGYPDLEYFIIDGGSTDESVNIIRKYEPWLAGWVSETDAGQSDAINKGFARCTGTIFNWLCSDDFLTAGALGIVANEFRKDDCCDVLAGACFCQYDDKPDKSSARSAKVEGWEKIPYHAAIWQPSCFFRRTLIERSDLVLRDLHFCMDRELWCYLFKRHARWKWIEDVLSHYRFTGANKSVTGKQKIIDEIARIYHSHVKHAVLLPSLLRRIWLPLVLAAMNQSSGWARMALRVLSRGVAMVLLLLYPLEHVRALQREFYQYSVW